MSLEDFRAAAERIMMLPMLERDPVADSSLRSWFEALSFVDGLDRSSQNSCAYRLALRLRIRCQPRQVGSNSICLDLGLHPTEHPFGDAADDKTYFHVIRNIAAKFGR